LFSEKPSRVESNTPLLNHIIGWIVDGLIYFLIGIWILSTLTRRHLPTSAIYSLLPAGSVLILSLAGKNDLFFLGVILLVFSIPLVFNKLPLRKFFVESDMSMCFGFLWFPVTLFFFYIWYADIGTFSFYSQGDDWHTYQRFARQIALAGEFLCGGETVLTYQPLYRYIVAALHILFGQSSFAQKMFDHYNIIFTGCFVTYIAKVLSRTESKTCSAAFAGILFVVVLLVSNSRYIVGRGLQEITATAFQMGALAFILRYVGSRSIYTLLSATACAILGFWSRMDHGIVLASFAFFFLTAAKFKSTGVKNYYVRNLSGKGGFFTYALGLFFAALAVYLRNIFCGGSLAINSLKSPTLVDNSNS
jgi:hypothetical protein